MLNLRISEIPSKLQIFSTPIGQNQCATAQKPCSLGARISPRPPKADGAALNRIDPPSLRGSEATKQSRLWPCSPRLDCFAAARNDDGRPDEVMRFQPS